MEGPGTPDKSDHRAILRNAMGGHAIISLNLPGAAAYAALQYPFASLAICIGCLLVELKPDSTTKEGAS